MTWTALRTSPCHGEALELICRSGDDARDVLPLNLCVDRDAQGASSVSCAPTPFYWKRCGLRHRAGDLCVWLYRSAQRDEAFTQSCWVAQGGHGYARMLVPTDSKYPTLLPLASWAFRIVAVIRWRVPGMVPPVLGDVSIAGHLFEPSVTKIGFRRGTSSACAASFYDFMHEFCPLIMTRSKGGESGLAVPLPRRLDRGCLTACSCQCTDAVGVS